MQDADQRSKALGRAAGKDVKRRARHRRFNEADIKEDISKQFLRDCERSPTDIDWKSYVYGYWCTAIAATDPEGN